MNNKENNSATDWFDSVMKDTKKKEIFLATITRIDTQEILQKYSEFQLFMNWNNAPDFDIELFERQGSYFAWVTLPYKDNPRFVLHISIFAKEFKKMII